MTLTPTARFHISLVNRRWYKDMLQGVDITNNEFIPISSNVLKSTSKVHLLPTQFLHNGFDVNRVEEFVNSVSSQSPNKISKTILKKRKFGELWGLGRKVMINAIENNNEDIYHELLGFFTSIQKRTSQRIINEFSEFNYNINNKGCIMGIQNPIERRPKGHPKSKRIVNALEKFDTKMSYKCKLCKKKGHNSHEDSNNEESSTTSTSHEYIREISDTEESSIS
ncbi:21901_t:CDS:2 [Cetraspora pellucida]|uniref:21901_t:CDS:1 n=1 Tax=Cetraspora pellucida TaxID=1433469 RepID=A0A9N9NFE7_9GLOM|nr:21901_t:CDS:2 [Cetraspora pellucida]